MSIVSSATHVGGRFYQEDRFFIKENFHEGVLMAVFDGHGGCETAEFCASHFSECLSQFIKNERVTRQAMRKAISLLNSLLDSFAKNKRFESGSTLSAVYIPKSGKSTLVCIVGDSPVIINNAENKIIHSPEHNARTNLKDREEVQKRGGYYENGYICYTGIEGGLQMTRVIGDLDFGNILIREPEIYRVKLGKEGFILVASDGLVDPSHRSMEILGDLLAEIRSGADAQRLVNLVVSRGAEDNVTCILWRKS